MFVRCPQCKGSYQLIPEAPDRLPPELSCDACGHTARVAFDPSVIGGLLGLDSLAQDLAEAHGIDVPSAYAVALGLLAPEQARTLWDTDAAETPPAPSPTPAAATETGTAAGPPPGPADEPAEAPPAAPAPRAAASRSPKRKRKRRRLRPARPGSSAPAAAESAYDPGFEPAVRAGFLTAHTAMERGDRGSMIARLRERHGLAASVAALVADNRLGLHAALLKQKEFADAAARTAATPPPASATERVALGAMALLLVGGGLLFLLRQPDDKPAVDDLPTPPAGAPVALEPRSAGPSQASAEGEPVDSTDVATDGDGRLTRVSGPSPISVLLSFCEQGIDSHRREALELTTAVPRAAGMRLGVFRDYDAMGQRRVIRILRDRESGRWIAGDGNAPIPVQEEPPQPADAVRVPVS